ncbi:MAG: zf-HC2 domain-containing protein, partial [Acidobacteriia bacterium]|nr:zf-HC2 domain-containing protein [Terriglobia bacterium]
MSCDAVGKLIPLYFYGELPAEAEERVEEHLHACAACAREMERQREFAAALDRRTVEIPPFLLEECRADLMAAVEAGAQEEPERPAAQRVSKGPWTLFLEALFLTFGGSTRWRQPVGAMALVAIGFFAARFTGMNPGTAQKTPSASPSDEVYATVRSVQAEPSGAVKIAFDETRRREVSGRMDDQNIQRLLLAAAREENPAVRVESVGVLKDRTASADVRDTLLNTLVN